MKQKTKISKQKMQEFKDKMDGFKYLRQQRASHYQGIYIALLVAAIVLFVDLVVGADIFLKIFLIIGLILIAEILSCEYKKESIVYWKSKCFGQKSKNRKRPSKYARRLGFI